MTPIKADLWFSNRNTPPVPRYCTRCDKQVDSWMHHLLQKHYGQFLSYLWDTRRKLESLTRVESEA